jgi:hypothetical protein
LKAGGMSLRKISAELAAQGHLTGGGNRRCSGWSARAGAASAPARAEREHRREVAERRSFHKAPGDPDFNLRATGGYY